MNYEVTETLNRREVKWNDFWILEVDISIYFVTEFQKSGTEFSNERVNEDLEAGTETWQMETMEEVKDWDS